MSTDLNKLFAPDPAIQSNIDISYEFSHIATYGDDTPRAVVFLNDNDLLEVPVHHFEMGAYDAWKNRSVLPTLQVSRAAAALVC